jgi:ABC-type uncharacterized transport system ATPase subunit
MIEISELTKQYAETVAVDDLSFTVRPGQVTGFLGPNGAGKWSAWRGSGIAAPAGSHSGWANDWESRPP